MSDEQRFQAILTTDGFRVQRLSDGELVGEPYASRFRAQQAAADLDETTSRGGGDEGTTTEKLRCPRCGSDRINYERDSALIAEALELRNNVLVLDGPPVQEWLDDVRLICVECDHEVTAEWTDERPRHVPDGQRPLHDGEALDALAAKLNEPGAWNGADVCELAAALLAQTGRVIADEPG